MVGGKLFEIHVCEHCGYGFVNPRPTLELLKKFYASSGSGAHATQPTLSSVRLQEEADPNSTLDAKRMIKTIANLRGDRRGGTLLDVGCGFGFFSKSAIEAGFRVVPLELAETERNVATEMLGQVPVASSFEDLQLPHGTMDVVLMSQILEHAFDVNLWLEKARSLLSPRGILAIALPNFAGVLRRLLQENDPYICPPAHLNFFSRRSLTTLMERHGFAVEVVQSVSRVPRRALERRLPGPIGWALPAMQALASGAFKMVDALELGMMVNVYGRRIDG